MRLGRQAALTFVILSSQASRDPKVLKLNLLSEKQYQVLTVPGQRTARMTASSAPDQVSAGPCTWTGAHSPATLCREQRLQGSWDASLGTSQSL